MSRKAKTLLDDLTLKHAINWRNGLLSINDLIPKGAAQAYLLAEARRAFERMLEIEDFIQLPEAWTWSMQKKYDIRTGRDLTDIIDEPGVYLTRLGYKASIHQILDIDVANCCKGCIVCPPRGKQKMGKVTWETWLRNGRISKFSEHRNDIVQKAD